MNLRKFRQNKVVVLLGMYLYGFWKVDLHVTLNNLRTVFSQGSMLFRQTFIVKTWSVQEISTELDIFGSSYSQLKMHCLILIRKTEFSYFLL